MPTLTIKGPTGENITVKYDGAPPSDADLSEILEQHEAAQSGAGMVPKAVHAAPEKTIGLETAPFSLDAALSPVSAASSLPVAGQDATSALLAGSGLVKPKAAPPVSAPVPGVPVAAPIVPGGIVGPTAQDLTNPQTGQAGRLTFERVGDVTYTPRSVDDLVALMEKARTGDKDAQYILDGQTAEDLQAANDVFTRRDLEASQKLTSELTKDDPLAAVSAAPANFAKGAVAPGLERYDALTEQAAAKDGTNVPGVGALASSVFTDIPGNVKSGVSAVVNNDGPARIGALVPDLAPDSLPGFAYNLGTETLSDPLNFILPGEGAATKPLTLPAKVGRVGASLGERSPFGDMSEASLFMEPRPAAFPVRRPPAPVPSAPVASAGPRSFADVIAAQGGKQAGPFRSTTGNPFKYGEGSPNADLFAPRGKAAAPLFRFGESGPPPVVAKPIPGGGQFTNAANAKAPNPFVAGFRGLKRVRQGVRAVRDVAAVPRTFMFGGDLGAAPLRQGLVIGASRPVQNVKAFAGGMKAFVSAETTEKAAQALRNRPNFALYEKHGLALTDAGANAPLLAREEGFMSKAAERVPVVGHVSRAGNRAASTYLNALRASAFDTTVKAWEKGGVTVSDKELDALSKYLNMASGRADLGKLEPAAEVLTDVFASPRFQASRAKLLNPITYAAMPPAVRKLAVRDMLAALGSSASLLGVAHAAGGKVSLDPFSADYGKAVFGDKTRLDFGGGFNQWVRFAVMEATGKKRNGKGELVDAPRAETLGKFTEARLAPTPSLIVAAFRGTEFDGEPFTWKEAAYRRLTSLLVQDVRDSINENGFAKGALLASPGLLGANVQTYPTDGNLWDDAAGAVGLDAVVGRVPGGGRKTGNIAVDAFGVKGQPRNEHTALGPGGVSLQETPEGNAAHLAGIEDYLYHDTTAFYRGHKPPDPFTAPATMSAARKAEVGRVWSAIEQITILRDAAQQAGNHAEVRRQQMEIDALKRSFGPPAR